MHKLLFRTVRKSLFYRKKSHNAARARDNNYYIMSKLPWREPIGGKILIENTCTQFVLRIYFLRITFEYLTGRKK